MNREFTDPLNDVKALVVRAADLARAKAGSVTPQQKDNASFVTDLDFEIERLVRGELRRLFPEDLVTGEELEPEGPPSSRRWSIDPIDGTGNLVHGLPLWAISVGLIVEGVPSLGVIAVPPLRELYWGALGEGAWLDGRRLVLGDSDAVHSQDNVGLTTHALRALSPRKVPGRLRDLGSSCTDFCFLAAGRLKAAIFLGERPHDLAAGLVIASEAGCHFSRLDGTVLSPKEAFAAAPLQDVLAAAPPKRLADLVRRLGAA